MPLIPEVSDSTSEIYADLMVIPIDLDGLFRFGGTPDIGKR